MKTDELIEDWLNKESDVSERDELERIIAFTEKLSVPTNTSKDQAWNSLLGKIEEQAQEKQRILIPENSRKSHWILWISGYAAALLIISFVLFKQYQKAEWTIIVADIGQTETLELPDASEIVMNASSEVSYSLEKWDKERKIQLYGEAFFEVSKGKPFIVETANGLVKVVGTSFNVYSREDEFIVACKTGMVIVESNNQTLTLTAGQMSSLKKGTLELGEYPLDKIAAWRIGEFYFDATPLSSVIDELERQFNINIIVNSDLSDRFYSGFFSKKSLQEALQLVCVPMGLKFDVEEAEVIIN